MYFWLKLVQYNACGGGGFKIITQKGLLLRRNGVIIRKAEIMYDLTGVRRASERKKYSRERAARGRRRIKADGERDALFVKYGIGAGYVSTKG